MTQALAINDQQTTFAAAVHQPHPAILAQRDREHTQDRLSKFAMNIHSHAY
jgi:hypothetical protein